MFWSMRMATMDAATQTYGEDALDVDVQTAIQWQSVMYSYENEIAVLKSHNTNLQCQVAAFHSKVEQLATREQDLLAHTAECHAEMARLQQQAASHSRTARLAQQKCDALRSELARLTAESAEMDAMLMSSNCATEEQLVLVQMENLALRQQIAGLAETGQQPAITTQTTPPASPITAAIHATTTNAAFLGNRSGADADERLNVVPPMIESLSDNCTHDQTRPPAVDSQVLENNGRNAAHRSAYSKEPSDDTLLGAASSLAMAAVDAAVDIALAKSSTEPCGELVKSHKHTNNDSRTTAKEAAVLLLLPPKRRRGLLHKAKKTLRKMAAFFKFAKPHSPHAKHGSGDIDAQLADGTSEQLERDTRLTDRPTCFG
ncbi:hypothetical protein BC831DRAFT_167215 [Entophlyctis helioformis]|nr:hypothetical protein BC831DRAFT_167215 [Entophlyctis helioformis]